MKIILPFLICMLSVLYSACQVNHKSIDTQFYRLDDVFNSYTISIDTLNKEWLLEILTNQPVKYFSSIKIIECNKAVKLKIKRIKSYEPVDDASLATFHYVVDFDDLKFDFVPKCELFLQFSASSDKYSFQLPFNGFLLKKYK